jgi:hypothetical protein
MGDTGRSCLVAFWSLQEMNLALTAVPLTSLNALKVAVSCLDRPYGTRPDLDLSFFIYYEIRAVRRLSLPLVCLVVVVNGGSLKSSHGAAAQVAGCSVLLLCASSRVVLARRGPARHVIIPGTHQNENPDWDLRSSSYPWWQKP